MLKIIIRFMKVSLLNFALCLYGSMPLRKRYQLMIISADTNYPGGSRGDEAMHTAIIEQCSASNDSAIVLVSKRGRSGFNYLPTNRIYKYVGAPDDGVLGAFRFISALVSSEKVVLIGADSLDGVYGEGDILIKLKILSRLRRKVNFLISGASFGASCSARVAQQLRIISNVRPINIRDIYSYERFVKLVSPNARLVADCAFLMEPQFDSSLDHVRDWIKSSRNFGATIIGLNVHPHLFMDGSKECQEIFLNNLVDILSNAALNNKIAFLLVPHDDRPGVGDLNLLEPLRVLMIGRGLNVFCLSTVPAAPIIKGLMTSLDCVVSARMHLAIAALGVGIPVLPITYQGKFEGMLQHFRLDEKNLFSPQMMIENPKHVSGIFIKWLEGIDLDKSIIATHSVQVKKLAKDNFRL